MAKSKKNRKNLTDKVRHRNVTKREVKNNPFEIRINRQKHHILGKKMSKHDKGLPGVSRSRAIKKRKNTLLKEYQQRNKSNKFVDRRFGENDPAMSVEEKMLQRFSFERQRGHAKDARYDLNEEGEELTHYGQSLADIEKIEEPRLVSDDDEEEETADGKLGANYVNAEHFGGFLTKKRPSDDTEKESKPKSRQEILEEVISNSKKEKYERQHEKEDVVSLTEKLDEDWRNVASLISCSKRDNSTPDDVHKSDDYDIAVRELMFDMKAKATDKMKTPEEIAKEEKERLEKLEEERRRRMLGIDEDAASGTAQQGHHSADGLSKGYSLYTSSKHPRTDMLNQKKTRNRQSLNEDEDDDEVDDENESDDEEEEEMEEEEEEEEDDDDDDSDSDLESADPESEDDSSGEGDALPQIYKADKEIKAVTKQIPPEELPYTFKAPENQEDFLDIVSGQSFSNRLLVIDRIRTCHHPSLAAGNKGKLDVLLSILLRYFGSVTNKPVELEFLDGLSRHIYELAQQSALHAGQCMLSVIVAKYEAFNQDLERRERGVFPPLDTLLYFQLVGLIFPPSDFRHGVVTPTMLFMGQILSSCSVRSCKDVASGLFVCSLFLKFVGLSKRLVPEVINWLVGLLFLAADKEPGKIYDVVPPFKPIGRYINILQLQSKSGKVTRNVTIKPQRLIELLTQSDPGELDTDQFRSWALATTLGMLTDLAELYRELPSAKELFAPVLWWLRSGNIPVKSHPAEILEQQQSLLNQLALLDDQPKKCLQHEQKRPKPLPMFEPLIEENYDPIRKKKNDNSSSKNEKQRLMHNYKKEMKGAMREIRKDAQFLSREKLKEQRERDLERKEKVKRIHQLLAGQEGDYKAIKRGRINLK